MRLLTIFVINLFISIISAAQLPSYKTYISANAPGGYYFLSPLEEANKKRSYNMILDSLGNVIYYRQFSTDSAVRNFCIQPNGLISYFNNKLDAFLLMDSTFNVVDTVSVQNCDSTDNHEFQILPNGHYLLFAIERITKNLNHYFLFGHGSQGSLGATVFSPVIQELDENKHLVFEWYAKDHYPFDSVDPFFTASGSSVDWMHSNALELDRDGNILLSARNFDEITKINRKDGRIMWHFGGKYNQFKFTGDTVPFYGQHDIRRLDNGHITLFDDGKHTIHHGARALEYELDETNKTACLVWSCTYDSSLYSTAAGNVQRLKSSSTLIYWGKHSNKNVYFNVVDYKGANLFKLTFKDKITGYRVFNYATLPWKLHRPEISCFNSGGTFYLDAGKEHGSYKWSNGSTTQIVAVTKPDTLSVFVPYGQGGFISSEKIIITDIHNPPCNVAGDIKKSSQDRMKSSLRSHN